MTAAVTGFPNWFAMGADKYFERHLTPLAGRDGLRFVQIGVFTGDATMWLLDNVLTGDRCVLYDVDTWEGSDEDAHRALDFREVERYYDLRTAEARAAGRLVKFKGRSSQFFSSQTTGPYDFAYIDGDHAAASVYYDGTEALVSLKRGGLLAFDDYEWSTGRGDEYDPGPGIRRFWNDHRDRLEVVDIGGQAWFRRVT